MMMMMMMNEVVFKVLNNGDYVSINMHNLRWMLRSRDREVRVTAAQFFDIKYTTVNRQLVTGTSNSVAVRYPHKMSML